MPFDPISAGIAGAGLIFDFIKNQQARKTARASQAFQREQLAQQQRLLENALLEARAGQGEAMRTAGGLRLDQFGNATYYDPTQGRWITSFSPAQQRIIDEGQARQRRAQIRGAQAAEDYDRLRAEYLYRRPKTEAESYGEIARLINQAQGTGEQALNTLMNRFNIRTTGNLPQLVQAGAGPSPGQQLAETMLKARGAALEESLKREAGHGSRYLPALKQFEETANYVAPIDPTGAGIISMQQKGLEDLLKTGTEYDKLLANLAVSGGRNLIGASSNVGQAYSGATTAAKGGPGAGDFLALAKLMMPEKEKAAIGTLGGTRGARASTTGSGTPEIGTWDRRYSFGPTTRGAGGEAAPFGGATRADYNIARDLAMQGDVFSGPPVPDYGNYWGAGGGNYLHPSYRNPWTF